MITFKDLTLRRGAQVLFEHADFTIYYKQRVGLIGANGSGKSSLFSLLLGELSPDQGDLLLPKILKIAHVEQETPGLSCSALEHVLSGDDELMALNKALSQAEDAEDGMAIADLHEKLGHIDAYSSESRAAQLLAGLGFSHHEQQKKVSDFSGGFRVRLNLAKALMCRSDMLILDEPTNHLDLDAVIWLEDWLLKYPGTLIIISHDRDFLDRIVGYIAHIEKERITLYTGNYSTFEKTRAEKLLLQQAAYEKQQKKIAHMQAFVNRFGAKASKAKQAQSRLKAIERMDIVAAVQTESPFEFEFKTPRECPYPLLQLKNAEIRYGDNLVLKNINFSIAPRERIAILGPNGAGKSSFIKLLANEILPASGVREASSGLQIGYFAQHQVDHLDLNKTPLLHLRDYAGRESELDLRKFLGGFDFRGDRVNEPINNFSGGEKSRLSLALIVYQRPNLLLLDEPTNHLDLDMREALSLALQEYEGAMILVSHDRFLVRTTTDEMHLIADKKLTLFEGDLDDYQTWLTNFRREESKKLITSVVNVEQSSREDEKLLLNQIKKIETSLEKATIQLSELDQALADPNLYTHQSEGKIQDLVKQQKTCREEISVLEEKWLALSEKRNK